MLQFFDGAIKSSSVETSAKAPLLTQNRSSMFPRSYFGTPGWQDRSLLCSDIHSVSFWPISFDLVSMGY